MATASYSTSKYTLHTNDSQAIQKLAQSITTNIQKISQNVSQIENMNFQIGTLKDSEALRERLLQLENSTNQLAKDTNNQLKELNNFVRHSSSQSAEDRQLKFQKERLTNDLLKTLNKFQEVQKSTMQKQKESNERAKSNLNFNTNEDGFRLEELQSTNNQSIGYDSSEIDRFNASQNVQISMESDINLVQIKEREDAIKRLEHDILDVNMIFKDLAVMVHDQGEIIDSIESNVSNVQVRVNEANTHLESAKKHQEKARKRKFILICILTFVLAVITFLIILSIQPWRD
ncbi:unnamed protein product [Brachionus calyciflorus]|uniref:t-SNARE coiled-coil homology domain-containing protein n=1 Tax=Brachionus calyciflorus TaxID=104777 RepID=A0A813M4M9_9BILA|nr:unnamed protein product [Brachionus calyciflorus]